jgi:hypothetical protein
MRYGRTPDTVCLLAGMAVVGTILTAVGFLPPSVQALAPPWVAAFWGAVLASSSALALAGVLWRDPLWGWALELAGRPGVACSCAGYAAALAMTMGTNYGAALAVVVFGSIAVSSGLRIYQLTRRIQQFLDAIAAQRGGRRA